jgi:hypothetical protein
MHSKTLSHRTTIGRALNYEEVGKPGALQFLSSSSALRKDTGLFFFLQFTI